ncbi:J domain-containing protein [Nocardioides pacificus]
MQANWYDLLDVDPGASTEEIRTAWKSAVADLDPTDRRFRVFNQAAEVLLDDDRRAAYDAELAAQAEAEAEPALLAEAEPEPEVGVGVAPEPEHEPDTVSIDKSSTEDEEVAPSDSETVAGSATSRRAVPLLLLVGLGVLALVLAAGAVATHLLRPSSEAVADAAEEAERAAQQAATIVFSYDHTRMDADREAASALLTGDYREEYEQLFAVLEDNAPRLGTKVEAEFISSGIVRTGSGRDADDRVQVFVAFDQVSTDKQNTEPGAPTAVYAVLTMEKVDGEWLVSDVQGPPIEEAPAAEQPDSDPGPEPDPAPGRESSTPTPEG